MREMEIVPGSARGACAMRNRTARTYATEMRRGGWNDSNRPGLLQGFGDLAGHLEKRELGLLPLKISVKEG